MAEQLGLEVAAPAPVLVLPTTGELISRDDPAGCARALQEMDELEAKLKVLKGALREVLLEESVRFGGKTLHFEGGLTATIPTPVSTVWDRAVLLELLAAGLSEERFEALVRTEISYKINGSVAKELAGANPVYAEIIERAKTRIDKTPSVAVKATKRA